MTRRVALYALLIIVFYTTSKGQKKTEPSKPDIISKITGANIYTGPTSIVRNIEQDRNGNIWLASWDGVFKYDVKGKFTNVTSGVSKARFFSVLEDRKGTMWFGTIGSGVYSYDGTNFQNFTTREGLVNNEIVRIFEDKAGNIWFGENGGVSRFDGRLRDAAGAGKSVQNYMMTGDSMVEEKTGKTFPDFTRPPNEVNSIIEDKPCKFWFATRGNTYVYDGKKFTLFTHDGKPFANVRALIEDRKGNIWFGGNDGLWRYDGKTFTNIRQDFTGYIYEDKNGNIWTCSANQPPDQNWILSRYDANSLSDWKPTVTELKPGVGGIFGIFEAADGRIWFGSGNGVYRYDGITFERP
jgi:ligand-binding sensor domain-containing protein